MQYFYVCLINAPNFKLLSSIISSQIIGMIYSQKCGVERVYLVVHLHFINPTVLVIIFSSSQCLIEEVVSIEHNMFYK